MDNYKELLEKLMELTKSEIIMWSYLDSFKTVCEALAYEPVSPSKRNTGLYALASAVSEKMAFDSDNSFIARINNNYVILFCRLNDSEGSKTLDERLNFLLVPRTFKGVSWNSSESSEGALLRLHSLVKSGFPSVDNIISDIFEL